MVVLSIVNQKGGVGKTTTSVNLSCAFAAVNKKTLLIDLDSQGNAGTSVGIDYPSRSYKNSYNMFCDSSIIRDMIHKTEIPDFDIIPSTLDLSAVELEFAGVDSREFILKKAIEHLADDYEFIILDCPPSLGLITVNALTASSSIIIPIQCEFLALEGLKHLLDVVSIVQSSLNPELSIDGVLLTMFDARNKLSQLVEKDVREHLGDKVYKTIIPRNVKLSESPSYGKPAIVYDYKCSGAKAYLMLARELLVKQKQGVEHV